MRGIFTSVKSLKVSIQLQCVAKHKAQNHVHVNDNHDRIYRNLVYYQFVRIYGHSPSNKETINKTKGFHKLTSY